MEKVSKMNRWCDRQWIIFGLWITVIMTAVILVFWNDWSTELKILAAIAALVPIHVVEEWVFPGGFHYQYNYFNKSDQLDRYPMCRKSDMFTNLIATFGYVALTIWCAVRGEVPTGIIMGTIGFCLLEVILHTMFGIQMYNRFKSKGKTTIYGPGSITAYFCFGVYGVILGWCMAGRTITGADWWMCAGVILFIGLCCVIGPESIIKKKDNEYFFKSAGYFERFL